MHFQWGNLKFKNKNDFKKLRKIGKIKQFYFEHNLIFFIKSEDRAKFSKKKQSNFLLVH